MGNLVSKTVLIGDRPRVVERLSIAQMQELCSRAAQRRVENLVVAGKRAGLSSREVVEVARDAMLSSDLLTTMGRECCTLSGMFDVISVAFGAGTAGANDATDFFMHNTPPEGMSLALWLVGMDAEGNDATGR